MQPNTKNMIKTKKVNTFIMNNTPINVLCKIVNSEISTDGVIMTTTAYLTEVETPAKIYYNEYLLSQIALAKSVKTRLLLDWICLHLRYGADRIRLTRDLICKDLDIKTASYYNIINDLVFIGVITKDKGEWWFINPYFIFKGDRVAYFKKKGKQYLNLVNTNTDSLEMIKEDNDEDMLE